MTITRYARPIATFLLACLTCLFAACAHAPAHTAPHAAAPTAPAHAPTHAPTTTTIDLRRTLDLIDNALATCQRAHMINCHAELETDNHDIGVYGDKAPTTAPCQEDQACWDCSTMGNHICGSSQKGDK